MESAIDSFNKKLEEPLKMNTEIITRMKEQIINNINEIDILYNKIERQKEVVGKERLNYYYSRIKELVLLNKSLKEKQIIINKNFNKRMTNMADKHFMEEKKHLLEEIKTKKINKEICYYYITLINKVKYTKIFEDIKNRLCCIYEEIILNQLERKTNEQKLKELEVLQSFKCELMNESIYKLQNNII